MFLACGSWCAHLSSSPLFHRCRTVLAFPQSIKPTDCVNPVESQGNLFCPNSRFCGGATAFSQLHNYNHNNKSSCLNLKTIRLVVVMSAVELWKAQQLLLTQWSGIVCFKWRIVGNGENSSSHRLPKSNVNKPSTALNSISASSPTAIHRPSRADFYSYTQNESRWHLEGKIPRRTVPACLEYRTVNER